MGNFYCVPSGCAEVVYQEYLPPKIRWRYPGEEWREKIADDYSLVEQEKQCPGIPYRLFYSRAIISNGTLSGWTSFSNLLPPPVTSDAPYTNIRLIIPGSPTQYYYGTPVFHWSYNNRGINPNGSLARAYQIVLDSVNHTNTVVLNSTSAGIRLDAIEPDGTPNPCLPDCLFTITKNGAIVHQETRSVCPEVEKLPCRISDEIKRIEIEKFPWLERVEVVDWAYDVLVTPVGAYVYRNPIPNQCLNIYKNGIAVIIPPVLAAPANYLDGDLYGFIAQICSAPGCPPPEYQVLCDGCGCESCPDGTHPLCCSGYVCCYGSDGKVVKEIPIENYCGGDCCCE